MYVCVCVCIYIYIYIYIYICQQQFNVRLQCHQILDTVHGRIWFFVFAIAITPFILPTFKMYPSRVYNISSFCLAFQSSLLTKGTVIAVTVIKIYNVLPNY